MNTLNELLAIIYHTRLYKYIVIPCQLEGIGRSKKIFGIINFYLKQKKKIPKIPKPSRKSVVIQKKTLNNLLKKFNNII